MGQYQAKPHSHNEACSFRAGINDCDHLKFRPGLELGISLLKSNTALSLYHGYQPWREYNIQWRAQNYLESVSWAVIMIVISNLAMSIVEREPGGFRITVTL